MSHRTGYLARMNSLLARFPRSPRNSRVRVAATASRPDLTWIHDGARHRVSVWPDVRFERELGPDEWVELEPGEGAFASAALGVTGRQWRRYSSSCRRRAGILGAIPVQPDGGAACPHALSALLHELVQVPALTAFLTAHLGLRGGDAPAWGEISAVYERDGLFGVLQWLGLRLPTDARHPAARRRSRPPAAPARTAARRALGTGGDLGFVAGRDPHRRATDGSMSRARGVRPESEWRERPARRNRKSERACVGARCPRYIGKSALLKVARAT